MRINVLEGFRFIVQRCFVLYLCAGVILFLTIDSSVAQLNRLNHLKQFEHSVKSFEQGLTPFDVEEFRWTARYYKELLKFFSPNDLIYGNLGFCYFYLKDYTKAMEAYLAAIDLEQYFYVYYFDVGLIFLQSGDIKNALAFFDTALKLLPKTTAYYETLAERLPDKHKNMMGLTGLLKKRAGEDEAITYYYLGLVNFRLGDYPSAARHLNKAIELNPADISAYYHRGLVMEKLGNTKQHQFDFQKVKYLKSNGVEESPDRTKEFRPHLNTELVTLRYLIDRK